MPWREQDAYATVRLSTVDLNPDNANLAPRWDWPSQRVFNGQLSDVECVFVDGKVRKAHGRVLDVNNRQELLDAVQAATDRLRSVATP